MLNHVTLMGNMTRDPEMRYTPKGTAVCSGAVAVNRVWNDEQGQKKEEVSYIDWTAFGRTAEIVSQYLKKGDPFLFEGRLKQERWEDKGDGKPRSKVVVIVDRMTFVPNRKNGGQPAEPAAAASKSSPQPADTGSGQQYQPPLAGDDDVPF